MSTILENEDYTATVSFVDEPEAINCHCDSCEWHGTADQLSEIGDAMLTPGDPSPAGRCPECDALAYVAQFDLEESLHSLLACAELNQDSLEAETAELIDRINGQLTPKKCTTQNMKFFVGRMYVMYDGREFPEICFYQAKTLEAATEMHDEAAQVRVNEDSGERTEFGYEFEAGALVVRPEALREISRLTYQEMQHCPVRQSN